MLSSWALVAIIAIIAGTVSSIFQNNRSKSGDKAWADQLNSLQAEMKKLNKRIQNLEAIAAGDPEDFRTQTRYKSDPVELDDLPHEDNHEKEVSRLANQLKNK